MTHTQIPSENLQDLFNTNPLGFLDQADKKPGRNSIKLDLSPSLSNFRDELAIEDMALSIHLHPTLSETEGEAAKIFLDSVTHILSKAIKT
jgi:hypothetical protein